jgi:AcrR family transcriptional regulator
MTTVVSTLTGPQQRRERERAEAREVIVAAARELGRTEGWDAVTMRRLADKIEYSSNFAYRYFGGRDDILLAVARDGFARLRDAMAAAADSATSPGRKQANPTAAIRAAANAYIDFALAEPELYQLMYGLGGVRVPTADTFADGQAIGDILIRLLTDAGDTNAVNHVLQMWATVHGLIALLAVGRLDVDVTQLRSFADTAIEDVLTRALTTPARRRRSQASQQDPT